MLDCRLSLLYNVSHGKRTSASAHQGQTVTDQHHQAATVSVADHVKHADDPNAVCLLLRNSYMTIAQARELAHAIAVAADDAEMKLPS